MGDYRGNIDRFSGFAESYDRYRFHPPAILQEVLCRYANREHPDLVVDLGCGTGLSTRFWADLAERVVGVEPADDMRGCAIARTAATHVEYRPGYGHETGLPDACADIVTCSQSFHWMEPSATLAEVGRILRPCGVFAAYDYQWPAVTGIAELDAAIEETSDTVFRLEEERGLKRKTQFFATDEHAQRMQGCGIFSLVRKIYLHSVEATSPERLVRGFETQGALQTLRRQGVSDEEMGLTRLDAAARNHLGSDHHPIYVSYFVHIGLRS